ncbi:D-2-hydroxyacid dehydrogenase family protein [Roseivivax marinus]|uniref:D-2-hydroxyacid dehydrogenase family protein n=1 Tax=Roseivivax marinus TaxID=1379903 RepID=UPI001F03BE6F|nr:D-2-hydroxyacid dehydrogenase family protein [Roseivivax marinus]UMA64922.1 D-2-hydroxyacid dehydrogenase family protein [Roseivivax marinus]
MPDDRPLPRDRKARIAVLDDYMGVAHRMADWSRLEDRAELTFLTDPLPAGGVAKALAPYDAISLLRERTPIPGDVLRALPDLKAIAMTGRRNRTLDDETARDLGITVMTTEGSGNGIYATVELAWGHIIALMRCIPEENAAMHEGAWQTRLGSALYGRTLGLVGLGKLGSRMAGVAQAFGMNVIAWSPNLTSERATEGGAEYADKATLFAEADVISLHLVLGPSTRGIVGAEDLGRMKSDAILVNTSRGPLVDQNALLEALRTRSIRGAGIDVYDREPLPADHPIRDMDNALLTPHLGYATQETFRAFYGDCVDNLDGWLDGAPKRVLEG